MAVMWLNVIDEGMPTARRKGIVSSLLNAGLPPQIRVFGGFSHSAQTKSINARRAPNEYVWGPC
jgi:hypothetical protein